MATAEEGVSVRRVHSTYAAEMAKTLERTYTEVRQLEKIPAHKQLTIHFKNVSAWVVDIVSLQMQKNMIGMKKAGAGDAPPAQKQILTNLSGHVAPGEVLALMGPSGGGKTSLLSAIAGRAKFVKSEGVITFNGQELTKSIKRRVGFVMQDDLLFESLTVYESCYYAAMLRCPRTMTHQEKLDRVQTVLNALGLNKCKNTLIGGFMRRGISGGERKRVSIGHELLINPSALFLDEPTSGLDATTALKLVHTLRSLAQTGRSVITTIHQPSSRMYQELDKLLLLSEGRAIYMGDAQAASKWFEQVGYKIPYGINVADFLLDLASGDIAADESSTGTFFADKWDAYLLDGKVDERERLRRENMGFQARRGGQQGGVLGLLSGLGGWEGGAGGGAESDPSDSALGATLGREVSQVDTEAGFPKEDKTRTGASWPAQVGYLTQRFMKVRRFESLGMQRFLQLIVVGLLTGLFWWQRGGATDSLGISDVGGLLFFEMLFMAFAALFAALFTFPQEFRLMVKERASGMYRMSSFYIARIAADLPLDCLYPTLFVLIIYTFGGLRPEAGAFFANWGTIILLLLTAQSIGLFLGAAMMNPKSAQTVATILMLAFMLTGGFYVAGIPSWIAWVKYLGFIYYGWNILLYVEYNGRQIESWPEGFPALEDLKPGRDLGILFAMLIFSRICIYYVLRKKTSS